LYLQGRFFENRHSEKDATEALTAYWHAVQLDPGFARAWAGAGRTHVWMAAFISEGGQKAFDEHLASARDEIARALAIEPNLTDALYARAWIETNFDFDWSAAAATVRKGIALAPADPGMLIAAGNLEGSIGNSARSIELYRKAVELDPVNAQSRSFLAFGLATSKRFSEAKEEYARVAELNPSAPWAHAGLGLSYLLQNKFEEAATEAQADAGEWARLLVVSCARWAQKRVQESDAALNQLIKNEAETAAYQIADAYAYRGDKDKAFEWLERARRQRDPGLGFLRTDPLLINLYNDPRWNTFLRAMRLADDQLKNTQL
jgi:tetratricopeptide (TPR) repeat protein